MAFNYLKAKISILPRVFSPTLDTVFSRLPFWQRWRLLLLLQPINFLAAVITSQAWLFNNRYGVISVPTRSGKRRCLVYQPPVSHRKTKEGLRPLHIDIHGGGWIGGIAEQGSRFCSLLSDRTGAFVVSITYRIAPRHIYPAAHDDVDDIVSWLIQHAKELGVDSSLVTIGGSSVGATLALSACQYLHQKKVSVVNDSICAPLAFLGFFPALDFRQKPEDKPKPPNFPTSDPTSILLPLFDVYAGTHRSQHLFDARLHTLFTSSEMLPKSNLIVAAGIDILLHEALIFVERVQGEVGDTHSGPGTRIECIVVEKGFHGFLELPHFILEEERVRVFERAVKFITEAHVDAGFDINTF